MTAWNNSRSHAVNMYAPLITSYWNHFSRTHLRELEQSMTGLGWQTPIHAILWHSTTTVFTLWLWKSSCRGLHVVGQLVLPELPVGKIPHMHGRIVNDSTQSKLACNPAFQYQRRYRFWWFLVGSFCMPNDLDISLAAKRYDVDHQLADHQHKINF